MSTTLPPDAPPVTMDEDALRRKEDKLRLKEKELNRREQLYRERYSEMEKTRANLHLLMQELDAKECVLVDAEQQHGSLLKREESCEKKEREQLEKQRQLDELESHLNERVERQEEELKEKQKDYEARMFPLAAQEQEMLRREADVHALEIELDAKSRAFQKRIQQEEDRERQRDKQAREQENRIKDQLAKIDKKQQEIEQQSQQLQDRHKVIKAEQVELETRDRDLKWRDDQLRGGHAEVFAMKQRLVQWEKEVSIVHEQNEVTKVELEKMRHEMEVKELTLAERMTRLLAAEKEVSEKDKQTTERIEKLNQLKTQADDKVATVSTEMEKLQEQETQIAAQREELEAVQNTLKRREEAWSKKSTKIEEREKAVKNWVQELEWRENQLSRREQAYGRDMNAALGGKNGLAALQQGGGDGGTKVQPQLNRGIVKAQVNRIHEAYLAGSATPAPKRVDARNLAPLNSSSSPSSDLLADAEAETAAAELDEHVHSLTNQFVQCSVKYYSMDEEGMKTVFNEKEQDLFKTTFETEEQWKDEVRFLNESFGLQQQSSGDGRSNSLANCALVFCKTINQWQKWFTQARGVANARKLTVQSLRLAKLTKVVELFRQKEEQELLVKYFPMNHHRVLVGDHDVQSSRASASPRSSTTNTSKVRVTKHTRKTDKQSAAVKQVLDTLPEDLRKHYDSPSEKPKEDEPV